MGIFGRSTPSPSDPVASMKTHQELMDLHQAQYQQGMQNAWPNGLTSGLAGMAGLLGSAGIQMPQAQAAPVPQKELPQEEILCATGGLIGWRTWDVPMFGSAILSFNKTRWEPKQKFIASCPKGDKCAGPHCTCGIYSWKQRRKVIEGFNKLKHVMGEVWVWGRVLECEYGYRAEFAYPKSFVDTGLIAQKMAGIYGVNLIASNS